MRDKPLRGRRVVNGGSHVRSPFARCLVMSGKDIGSGRNILESAPQLGYSGRPNSDGDRSFSPVVWCIRRL